MLLLISQAFSQQYNFRNYSVQEGVAHSLVYSIYQDKNGNIWLGTAGGLSMFDGHVFKNYTTNDGLPTNYIGQVTGDDRGNIWFISGRMATGRLVKYDHHKFTIISTADGLANDEINHIFVDENSNVWIGTIEGVSVLNRGNSHLSSNHPTSYHTIDTAFGLTNNNVKVIIEDSRGCIWLGTDGGVNCLLKDPAGNWMVRSVTEENGLISNHVTALVEDHSNNIWVGTKAGITKLTIPESEFSSLKISNFNEGDGLVNNNIVKMIADNRGNIWAATVDGVSKFDGNSFDNFNRGNYHIKNKIKDLLKDKRGNVWIATENGLLSYDHTSLKRFTTKNGLSNNRIYSLLEDMEGNIWITTFGGGVCKFMGEVFVNFTEENGLVNDMIWSMCSDNSGNLWIGTDNGLSIFRIGQYGNDIMNEKLISNYESSPYLNDNPVYSIFEDTQGYMWLATKTHLLRSKVKNAIMNTAKSKFDFVDMSEKLGIPNMVYRHIFMDRNQGLWLGTESGVYHYDGSVALKKFEGTKLDGNNIYSTYEDSRGIFWFGTDSGLCSYDGLDIVFYDIDYGLNDKRVVPILEDELGNIWFGTLNNGFFRYNGEDFETINVKEGLSANPVYSMINDRFGNLLIGTNNGMNQFNYQHFNNTGEVKIKQYNVREGFKGNECNKNVVCEDEDGNFWFGTVKGVVRYNPVLDEANEQEPITRITKIKLFFEETDWSSYSNNLTDWNSLPTQLILPYDKNHLTFNFVGVSLKIPEKVRYQFILEGLDQEWHLPTTLTEITYSSLPHGAYTFKVKAMNNEGIWNSSPTTFSFVIRPPFWKTWLFYALTVSAICSAVYFLIKGRERNFKRRQRELELLVRHRTKQLDQKNKDITESINYAQRIQYAMFPPDELITKMLPEHFILYMPRDIVSGDFYWITALPEKQGKKQTNQVLVAAIDCTGHGVPGAFMSIVANNLLYQAVNEHGCKKPADILMDVNKGLRSTMRQTNGGRIRDGMDLALCKIDLDQLKLEFAGAANPLWIIRVEKGKNKLIEIEPDRFSMGMYRGEKEHTFANREIQLIKGDIIYLFSDGYVDQFGGEKGEKFKYVRLKELLLSFNLVGMNEQKERLYDKIEDWRGEYNQVDDILVMGIKV